jgi:diketogulonate reductase-like aldo/keto reductase
MPITGHHQSRSVMAHIAKMGTILEAWFPLGGRGTGIKTLSEHETITSIAQAHNKSAYQVILRWHLQCGTIAIPGSCKKSPRDLRLKSRGYFFVSLDSFVVHKFASNKYF